MERETPWTIALWSRWYLILSPIGKRVSPITRYQMHPTSSLRCTTPPMIPMAISLRWKEHRNVMNWRFINVDELKRFIAYHQNPANITKEEWIKFGEEDLLGKDYGDAYHTHDPETGEEIAPYTLGGHITTDKELRKTHSDVKGLVEWLEEA